jgi:hypothetical protein
VLSGVFCFSFFRHRGGAQPGLAGSPGGGGAPGGESGALALGDTPTCQLETPIGLTHFQLLLPPQPAKNHAGRAFRQ